MIESSELLQKLFAGASGSALGVWLAKTTGWDRVVSGVGGVVCSQLFTSPVVDYFWLMKYEAATAFVVGLLSMLLIRKVYEGVSSIDTKEIGGAFMARVRLFLGVKKDD
jgi:hypothetical protein